MRLPATITGTFQGTAQAFQGSLKTQPYLILAALVVVYIILGMLYESYIHPLTILSTLPSAGVGALLVLLIFHFDLSVIALIGIILLIGIVKKNGIMMVDFAHAGRARTAPGAATQSIRQACLLRFRPIMMTTMAALLGALPLMLGRGTGSELRQPLGYTMVGGLMLSQALTLFTTPVIYLYLDRFSLWLQARRRSASRSAPRRAGRRRRRAGRVAVKVLLVEDNERVTRNSSSRACRRPAIRPTTPTTAATACSWPPASPTMSSSWTACCPGDIDGLAIIEALRKAGNAHADPDPERAVGGRRAHPRPAQRRRRLPDQALRLRRTARAAGCAGRAARRAATATTARGRRSAHGPAVAQGDPRRSRQSRCSRANSSCSST